MKELCPWVFTYEPWIWEPLWISQ